MNSDGRIIAQTMSEDGVEGMCDSPRINIPVRDRGEEVWS